MYYVHIIRLSILESELPFLIIHIINPNPNQRETANHQNLCKCINSMFASEIFVTAAINHLLFMYYS